MGKKHDLVGKSFGLLTVIKHLGGSKYKPNQKHKCSWWLCECICGNVIERSSTVLLHTGSKNNASCGCQIIGTNNKRYKGVGLVSGTFMKRLRSSAKIRNLLCDVTAEYLWELFQKQGGLCALSGIELVLNPSSRTGLENTASVDRIDSKQSYIPDNVQWVHKDINFMKQDMSEERFISLCKEIACYHPRFLEG